MLLADFSGWEANDLRAAFETVLFNRSSTSPPLCLPHWAGLAQVSNETQPQGDSLRGWIPERLAPDFRIFWPLRGGDSGPIRRFRGFGSLERACTASDSSPTISSPHCSPGILIAVPRPANDGSMFSRIIIVDVFRAPSGKPLQPLDPPPHHVVRDLRASLCCSGWRDPRARTALASVVSVGSRPPYRG